MAGVAVTIGGNFSKLDELQSKALSVSARIKKGFQERIGHKMFDGLLQAANRIPGAISSAIEAASDKSEVVSKTGEVFQSSSQEMLDWSQNSATAFGQSAAAALGAAADYGNLFRAMDIAPAKAGEMSRTMVELAADLASFNNTSAEDAVTAIGSALRGEAEPIRKYGVLLNDATLKAEAMAQGLSDGKGTLDPTTKAMAAYSLILSQTVTAQGDFIRTSDGAANSSRIIKAQIADAAAAFGAEFLPAVAQIAAKLKVVDWEGVASGLASVLKAAISLAPALGAIGATMVALKIASFITALVAKTAAMYASATAARVEASAMATSAVATNTAATANTRAAIAARRNAKASEALGGVLAVAAIGAQLMAKYANELAEANNAMASSFDRGNAALKKFNAEKLRGEVTSREDIAGKLAEIEAEKEAIREATENQTKDMGGDLAARVNDDMEITIKLLDQQAKRLAATSDAQLTANRAKAEAVAAETLHAEAIRNTAKNFDKAKKSFEDAIKSGEKSKYDDSSLQGKIDALNKAEAKIRDGFTGEKAFNGEKDAAGLAKSFAKDPDRPGADKDMAAAAELLKIEQERASLKKQLVEKQAEEKAQRDEVLQKYDNELTAIAAELEGNDEKLNQLKREAEVRAKIAELMKVGLDLHEASLRANAIADGILRNEKRRPGLDAAQEAIANARAAMGGAGGKESALTQRIAELEKLGLSGAEAKSTANLESLTDRKKELDEKADNATGLQSIVASSSARIGAGGGVYVAGLDYQRQIADISREQLTVSKQIAAVLTGNRLFD